MQEHIVPASRLLVGQAEISAALGPSIYLEPSRQQRASSGVGEVLAAAARDVAYSGFSGYFHQESERSPVAVTELALVFDTQETAEKTFSHVAQAAHLSLPIGACQVAVETVTSAQGLVSYWGFAQHGRNLLVLTLDTINPQDVSMTMFRALMTLATDLLEGQER